MCRVGEECYTSLLQIPEQPVWNTPAAFHTFHFFLSLVYLCPPAFKCCLFAIFSKTVHRFWLQSLQVWGFLKKVWISIGKELLWLYCHGSGHFTDLTRKQSHFFNECIEILSLLWAHKLFQNHAHRRGQNLSEDHDLLFNRYNKIQRLQAATKPSICSLQFCLCIRLAKSWHIDANIKLFPKKALHVML